MLVSDAAVMENITLERVLWRLANADGQAVYQAFARSFATRAEAPEGPGPRCDDDAEALDGASTLNGFPIPCPAEAQSLLQVTETKAWKPLSVTNRFDLAPSGGETCGEQHLSFFLDRSGEHLPALPLRAFLRFSAVIANPAPDQGLEGCRPLVDFWASLSRTDYDNPANRARSIETAFLGITLSGSGPPAPEVRALIAAGYRPFISPEHFGRLGKLQLLYLGAYDVWHFFEHALVSEEEGWVLRRPLTQSLPVFSLLSTDPQSNPCATQLSGSIAGLLDDDPVNQRMNVGPGCFAGTNDTWDPTLRDGLQGLVPGGGYGPALSQEIELTLSMRYPQYGYVAADVATRADFAGTCSGCHQLKGSPYATPGTIAHVNQLRTEPCGSAGGDDQRRCYARSPLLKTSFLPRWTALLQDVWDRPGAFPALPDGAASTTAIDGTALVQQSP